MIAMAIAWVVVSASATDTEAFDRLITQHGVEIRADDDVLLFFSALNAAGYSAETKRKGPPLGAPIFDPLRVSVREALRRSQRSSGTQAVLELFERNPLPVERYLAAVLDAHASDARIRRLRADLRPVLARFRDDAGWIDLIDDLFDPRRKDARSLQVGLDDDLNVLASFLRAPKFRAPVDLVVIPNPLDAHGRSYRIDTDANRYLIVGPGEAEARRAVVAEVIRPTVSRLIARHYSGAKRFQRAWRTLKSSRSISARYKDGSAYLTEALVRAIAFRVRSPAGRRRAEADEAFVEAQTKEGMRWARGALRVLDKLDGRPFESHLGIVLRRAGP